MAKKIKYLLCVIVVLLVCHAYINRSGNVTRYNWKHTNDVGSIGGDFIHFDNNSGYSYHWPIIKKDGGNNGVVLLCINKRMILFSLTDYNIGVYMYI
jgi:hypothetical protein